MTESQQQPGNHNNLATLLGSMLKRILTVEIPCAINLPDEFLEEHKDFSCIPLLTLEKISFIQIPPDILDPVTNDTTPFVKLLIKKGITDQESIDELIDGLQTNMKYNASRNRVPEFYPLAWIPLNLASQIRTMKTPFERFGKKSFIYSLATLIPVNEDYRLRNVFFTQLIAILLKRVDYDKNTKLEYSYYISNNFILNLFIAVIG